MPRIKFMGMSHVHTLQRGDNFGGRLSAPLQKDVVFNRSNSWVVDSDEAGLSEDAVAVLLSTEDFVDVSDYSVVPPNQHQKFFLGAQDVSVRAPGADVADSDEASDEAASEQQDADEDEAPSRGARSRQK